VAEWTDMPPQPTPWWHEPTGEHDREQQEHAAALQEQARERWWQEWVRREKVLRQYDDAARAVMDGAWLGSEMMDAPDALRQCMATYLATHPQPDLVEGEMPAWA